MLPTIHNCSELPAAVGDDDDARCLDRIRSVFTAVRWLGGGRYGMVLLLTHKRDRDAAEEYVAAKVSNAHASDTELRIACQLNTLARKTPIFPHTYGWLVCTDVPAEWTAIAPDTQRRTILADMGGGLTRW